MGDGGILTVCCDSTGVYLTTYGSSVDAFMQTPIDEIAGLLEEGKIRIPITIYRLDQIVEAHRAMDDSTAFAKMVVVMD